MKPSFVIVMQESKKVVYSQLKHPQPNVIVRHGSFMRTKHLCALIHIRIKGRLATLIMSPPVKKITDRSKAVFLLWIIFIIYVSPLSVLFIYLSDPCSLLTACWERADLLALLCVMFPCVLPLSHMVSRVRCGTSLYRFQIFAFFTYNILHLQ